MKYYFDKVEDLVGIAKEISNDGRLVNVLPRELLTSDSPEFYKYLDQFSNMFLNMKQISIDGVCQFLVIMHQDLSADLYVNDIRVTFECRSKKSVKAGKPIMLQDIADIGRVFFPDIEIVETDKVVYCFKVGWRFGLFFDFTAPSKQFSDLQPKLDIEKMQISIGELRRYLLFYHVYKFLESEPQFDRMMKDGWFPFNEILSSGFKELSEAYLDNSNFESRVKAVVDAFAEERVKRIIGKWWSNPIFAEKKSVIEAGVNAYIQNNQDGFVNCIKNLFTEIEGVLRKCLHAETGKGNYVKSGDFIKYVTDKAINKSGSEYSLLLATPFLKYLKDVVFADFNVEAGDVDMSRNAVGHGVAEPQQYTRDRALQLILTLDQIYLYV